MSKLSIIIVSYNTRELLRSCLESIFQQASPDDTDIIVVDNASADGSRDMVKELYPRVHLIASNKNLGFAAANNLGLKESKSPYVLFLNPDVVVLPGAFTRPLKYLDQHSDVAVVGCKIMSPDGSVQQSAREFPTLWTLFLENSFLYKFFSHSGVFRNPWVTDVDREQEVDVVKGAFLLVKRSVLDSVGTMDERFFLYSEEQDLCRRVKQAGWKIVYLPIPAITHFEGGSSQPGPDSAKLLVFESEYRYFVKHHGVAFAKAACVIMAGGMSCRIVAWLFVLATKPIWSKNASLARERVASSWYSLVRILSILLHSQPAAQLNQTMWFLLLSALKVVQ